MMLSSVTRTSSASRVAIRLVALRGISNDVLAKAGLEKQYGNFINGSFQAPIEGVSSVWTGLFHFHCTFRELEISACFGICFGC